MPEHRSLPCGYNRCIPEPIGVWMTKFSIKCLLAGLLLLVIARKNQVLADVIPPGNKSVRHVLVFVDSPLLQSHRLVATPIRGFGGHEEVQAGQPFGFSTKYGTRLYVVPEDYVFPKKIIYGARPAFPSCEVPVSSITSVPVLSPVDSIRTTCELVSVEEDSIRVSLVDHQELDAFGRPVTPGSMALPLLAISASGLIGCYFIRRGTSLAEASEAD